MQCLFLLQRKNNNITFLHRFLIDISFLKQISYNIIGDNMNDKRKINYNLIVSILIFLLMLIYTIYVVIYKKNDTSFNLLLINAIVLISVSIIAIINQLRTSSKKKPYNLLNSFTVAVFAGLSFFIINSGKTVAIEDVVPNFIGKSLEEALKWGEDNKISIEQIYEYSDNYDEYVIFVQNVEAGTKISEVKNLTITISDGYNYDKKVILPSLVGQNIESLLSTIAELHLNNVKITYKLNEYTERDLVLTQSKTGEIRRNDNVEFTISLGKKEELSTIKMIDLTDSELFDAILFLEKNGIDYEIKSEFSETNINKVIKQSIEPEQTITPLKDKIIITISKGKKITVPDLLTMSINEIVAWVNENNLKIAFSDEYNNKVELGSIISSNYKKDDIVEEGTTVKIVTSKGALKMRKFSSLNDFRAWANTYNIPFEEEYEFNSKVAKGSIIKFSLEENDLIDLNDSIIVTISNGTAITIPNFVGKTKSEITTNCNNLNLNCSFNYSSYSNSVSKDTALAQNKKAGSSVVSGTSVLISLSKGKAQTYKVAINESQLTIGNASKTISTLKAYFAKNYPDVTFSFETRASNIYSNAGFIHESSQVTDGTNITQGKSYKVIITK